MEGKLVSYKSLFAVILILSLVQLTTAAKNDLPRMMLGRPLSCQTYFESCSFMNSCCPGTQCYKGQCVDDPRSGCVRIYGTCGFFSGTCCHKMECINSECIVPKSNTLEFSII
ncbi:uncharacterized protein [Spinacia oleracea]|uniref:Granulins domain-containing protein n=1 Tax=Spinacia oleracea TaxID=3562 RepID=A0A9R0JB47_SPIOL|nr:uncharacterized protein LOC110803414 [Spinacia oleracea]